jgi:hypothetical protein
MTRRFVICAAPYLWIARAQSVEDKGRQAMEGCLEAMGGAKYMSMEDRVEFGRAYSFYNEELSGLARARISVRHLKEPPSAGLPAIEERQAFGKNEDFGMIFAGGKAWQFSFRGARPARPEVLLRWTDSTLRNVFYILRHRLREPGMIFEHRGTEVLDNQPVEVVDVIDPDNRTVTVYLHYSTKLPVRQVYVRRDLKTRERSEEVTIYSKYRDVGGGVQWPFAIQRNRDGQKTFEMYAETVAINQRLPAALFQVEGRLKILPPAK